MRGATIISGTSPAARALVCALAETGEPLLWLGGDGEQAGPIASLGDPDGEGVWQAAVARAEDHGGLSRVLNLLVDPLPGAALGSIDYEAFDAAVLATLGRTYMALHATVPIMREAGGGRFLTVWEQTSEAGAEGLLEPVCLGGLELCTRVIAKEYAETPTVNVNVVRWDARDESLDVLRFWTDYLGGESGCYVTGGNIGGAAH